MKKLENHTLIYDNNCPMCVAYSAGFTYTNLLDKNSREGFSEMSQESQNLIDENRAKNEIAIIDHHQNKVFYGIDSILLIIGNSFPFLVKIAKFPPFYWLLKNLYKLISYNRKQIFPANSYENDSCVPDFNLKYRIFYIGFVWIFSAYILSLFYPKFWNQLPESFSRELIICAFQIIWQTIFLKNYLKDKFWDYLGNMMTVSLIGTFLLIPSLFFTGNQWFFRAYFFAVVFMMFLEHIRRCKILKIGFLPSFSWVIFRLTFAFLLFAIYSK